MGHDHTHQHKPSNIKLAFFLNLVFTVFEIIGGIYVNSIAIISDAIHDLGDTLSLGTAWYLQTKSKQEADNTFSFGYARLSLLGALITCIVLIVGSIFIVNQAVERLFAPEETNATGMLVFAIFGMAVNGYAAWKLKDGQSMNERVVSWHMVEDFLGWVAVFVVAIILHFVDAPYLDPLLSIFITAYILWNVFKRLKETLFLFLQGTPKEIDLLEVKTGIAKLPFVESLHHTHIWSLDGEHHVFTTHVTLKKVDSLQQLQDYKMALNKHVHQYNFTHFTIEIELDEEDCSLHA